MREVENESRGRDEQEEEKDKKQRKSREGAQEGMQSKLSFVNSTFY